MANSDPDTLMIKAEKLTKLSFTRWSADWKTATSLYEQAAIAYRFRKDNEKAKEAFEKASKGQEIISSPWDAAKHMESAAALAKELGHWNEVSDHYRRAFELYIECGRSQPASDALAKAASALEEVVPDEAVRLYMDACVILEEEGKEHMAFDLYRAVTSIHVKLERHSISVAYADMSSSSMHLLELAVALWMVQHPAKNLKDACCALAKVHRYTDAATILLRWGVAADKCNAVHSQCKAYLSAIIVYLYAHDFQQAQKCYNDCCQIETFLNSDQNRCASKLLSAYEEGDTEEIKHVAKSSTISNLDHVIIRLARKLPTGDLKELRREEAKEEEPLDENDLT